jgi:signal transduction histidine kinase
MKILASPGDSSQKMPVFKISEFLSLGKNLSYQFEVSKAAAEAKAALDVARHVAHDIRSPIVSLQMALHAAQNQLDPQIKSALNNSAQRISDIANDVLTNHTPANGISEARPPVQQLPMSVSLALIEMIDEKTLLCMGTSNVTVTGNLVSGDTLVEMRISDFKRVISNLIDNSIQAMPQGGEIQISYSRNPIECCISIKDNGFGMSAQVLEEILEKGGSFGKPGGKGLGFQWAKRKIEQVNGRILVSSTERIGTEVKVILPAITDLLQKHSSELRLSLVVKEA